MADHVSFFKAKALPGKRQAVVDAMNTWQREQKPKAKGYVASFVVASNSNSDDVMGCVRWDNTGNYMANASRPEQDAWFRQELRPNLAADPEWFDGSLMQEFHA